MKKFHLGCEVQKNSYLHLLIECAHLSFCSHSDYYLYILSCIYLLKLNYFAQYITVLLSLTSKKKTMPKNALALGPLDPALLPPNHHVKFTSRSVDVEKEISKVMMVQNVGSSYRFLNHTGPECWLEFMSSSMKTLLPCLSG